MRDTFRPSLLQDTHQLPLLNGFLVAVLSLLHFDIRHELFVMDEFLCKPDYFSLEAVEDVGSLVCNLVALSH